MALEISGEEEDVVITDLVADFLNSLCAVQKLSRQLDALSS